MNAVPTHLMVPKLLVPLNARIGKPTEETAASGIPAQRDVFEEALLGKDPIGHHRSPAEWMVSLAVHAAIVFAVMLVPLYYTQKIDLNHMQLTFLVAPPTPAPPPPPPAPMAVAAQQRPRRVNLTQSKLTMPTAIPKAVRTLPSTSDNEPETIGGVPGGVIGGVPGGQIGGVLGGLVAESAVAPPPPPPSAPAAAAPSGPLRVGGQVKAPRAIYKPQPAYPLLARQSRVEGIVEIDAIIDERGNVVQMHAVSGPGLLIDAALKAVRDWKYEPTYLNGEPYPIAMTIHVTFQLS